MACRAVVLLLLGYAASMLNISGDRSGWKRMRPDVSDSLVIL